MIARSAWAKVNLYLQVTGRRPDGYHELDSLIVFAAVGDGIEVAPASELSFDVDGPRAAEVPAGPDNLVLRAAAALREEALAHVKHGGRDLGAAIRLHKVLPAAAGIGGGSADAAAVLGALVELWSLDPWELPLDRIALALGADVPICRYGRPAFVSGLGEVIHRAPPLPAAWLVLVNPGVPLSTPDVFRAREGPFSDPTPWDHVIATVGELADCLAERRNDLEAPARSLAPVVGQALDRLRETQGCLLARMSGSGATCFGLYDSRNEARAARDLLSERQPDWWVADAQVLHGPLDKRWDAA